VATAGRSGLSSFGGGLLLGIGQRMAKSGRLVAVLEPLQVVPTALGGDQSAQLSGHPVGDVTCPPALGPVGCWTRQRRLQLLLLLS
jgi:hypothetical protein